MPNDVTHDWREVAASNRERITALEKESERTRDALHALRGEAATARYLGEKITDLASDVRNLALEVQKVARTAVQKPSQSGLALFGQYIGLGVAAVALLVAIKR